MDEELEMFLDSVEFFLESLIGTNAAYVNQVDEVTIISDEKKSLTLIDLPKADVVIFDDVIYKIEKGFIAHINQNLNYEFLEEGILKC